MLFRALVLFALAHLYHSALSQKVQIQQGVLIGSKNTTRTGTDFFTFLGVPYAAAPVKDLRFKEPKPHAGWQGERDARTFRPFCFQSTFSPTRNVEGEEDCLFANIFTPKLDPRAKLPVMIYIHGGGFLSGSSNFYKGKYLVENNVVLVVINYRLGVLGFMTFGDDVIPANLGLRDQTFAFKWVQDNIASFGGDPDAVTIFGGSAGAAAVDLHVVSPLSKGLFRNAIIQSGSAICPWAITPQQVAKQRTEAVTTIVGCPSSPSVEALECLRDIPLEVLVKTAEKLEEFRYTPFTFTPVIDANLGSKSFLPAYPLQLKPHKVNIMMGLNAYEGNMATMIACSDQYQLARELEGDPARKLLIWLNIQDQVARKDKKKVAADILKFYLKGDKISGKNIGTDFENLMKDFMFAHGSHKTALHYFKQDIPVYFYLNEVPVPPEWSLIEYVVGFCDETKDVAPGHGDESYFLFNDIAVEYSEISTPMTPVNEIHSKKFVKLWTTFAATGAPGENWSPVKSNKLEYLHMTNSSMTMKKELYKNRMEFIDTIPMTVNKYKV